MAETINTYRVDGPVHEFMLRCKCGNELLIRERIQKPHEPDTTLLKAAPTLAGQLGWQGKGTQAPSCPFCRP